MNVVRAVILALWIACAVLLGLIAGTLAVVPIAMEESLSPEVVPWLFTAIALSGSIVAAFLARLIPSVARTYSLARLILAGCVGWPLTWWLGVQTKDALKSASSHGIFAISATIEHMTVWNAVVAVVALLILLVPRRSAGPSETAA
jgi:hypothetical protein